MLRLAGTESLGPMEMAAAKMRKDCGLVCQEARRTCVNATAVTGDWTDMLPGTSFAMSPEGMSDIRSRMKRRMRLSKA